MIDYNVHVYIQDGSFVKITQQFTLYHIHIYNHVKWLCRNKTLDIPII